MVSPYKITTKNEIIEQIFEKDPEIGLIGIPKEIEIEGLKEKSSDTPTIKKESKPKKIRKIRSG